MGSFKEVEGCLLDDPVIPLGDKEQIEVLGESKSCGLWDELVSNRGRHFKLLGKNEWPWKVFTEGESLYDWLDAWNESQVEGFDPAFEKIDRDGRVIVYFFWMRECGVQTNWRAFRRNWINFLYEDEGCILIFKDFEESIVFSNGRSFLGTQNLKSPTSRDI